MIRFREKHYSRVKNVLKTTGNYIKRNPLLPISSLTASVSTANYITNQRREKKDQEYQRKQLESMDRLTRSLDKTTIVLNKATKTISNNKAREESPDKFSIIKKFFIKSNKR